MTATESAPARADVSDHDDRRGAKDYHDPPSADLFRRLALCDGLLEEQDLVDEIVRLHLPPVRRLASRYRGRGIPTEDLMQVAALGLVKAVRRYDCDRGTGFMAYAVPTITGEIKRHFRSAAWAVRPTRRLQELRPRIARATDRLSQARGRAPTLDELAAEVESTVEAVVEALACGGGYNAVSLDAPRDGHHCSWADLVPDPDDVLSGTSDRIALQSVLAALPSRERTVLAMRFFADMSQTQIGAEIGVTQMQVSRIISRALRRLRADLESDGTGSGCQQPTGG